MLIRRFGAKNRRSPKLSACPSTYRALKLFCTAHFRWGEGKNIILTYMGIKNWVDLAFRRMTLLPFQRLLTCLRPLFLPSGCWVWRFCWPGSLCTLATLLRASAVLVCPGASTQDHCLVGVNQNHLQDTSHFKDTVIFEGRLGKNPRDGSFQRFRREDEAL